LKKGASGLKKAHHPNETPMAAPMNLKEF